MAVYVDNATIAYGRMIMCHMVADTQAELLSMADKIQVQRKWLQQAGTYREHFDISKDRRKLAVAAGAIEIDRRQLAVFLREKQAPSLTDREAV